MLGVAPVWLVFVLQYTGRASWLTIPFRALLFAVPLATLDLIATNEDHGLMWTSEGTRREGSLLLANFTPGTWFWVDFALGASLVLAWGALLVLMLANSQRLYARQSLDILTGIAGPWAAYTLGLGFRIGPLPGLDPTVVTFLPAGLVLLWGIYRHRLVDTSPVAQDAVMEGMSDGTLVLDRRGRIVDLNPSAARCAPGRNATRPALPSPWASTSSRHFMHPNVTAVVGHVLEETGLPPESLVLEIKESVLHEDPMSVMKKLGVTFTVDNFGAGSSSLQQLRRFPLDVLKIDSSFIRSFPETQEDCVLVSAVINLAHALKLKVVAPGVENSRQLMQLQEMGCEAAQGHYFAEGLSHRAAFLVADVYY